MPSYLEPWGIRCEMGFSSRQPLVAADALFVRNECGRYNLARSMVELRRRGGIHDDEEEIWIQMSERDIYYPTWFVSLPYLNNILLINKFIEDIYFIPKMNRPPLNDHTFFCPYVRHHTGRQSFFHQVTYWPIGGSGSSSPPARDKERSPLQQLKFFPNCLRTSIKTTDWSRTWWFVLEGVRQWNKLFG